MKQADMRPLRRLIAHVAVSILALALLVWTIHLAAHWLVAKGPLSAASLADLREFVFLVQALLIGLFTLIVGSFVHRYPEPFFIFWYFGWIAWLLLYAARSSHLTSLDLPFNVLNTCFFLSAAMDLLWPKSLNCHFRKYPQLPKERFGSPAVWLFKYYRSNPRSLLLMSPFAIIVAVQIYLSSAQDVTAVQRYLPVVQYVAERFSTFFAIFSVSLLGYGLYRRLEVISPNMAFGTLFIHVIYLEPQIAVVKWPAVPGHDFDFLLTVSAPALILKPALALFVTVMALRETAEKRDDAQRKLAEAKERIEETERRGTEMLKKMVQNLPAACLLVRDGKIALLNDAARQLLGLASDDGFGLDSIFASTAEERLFLVQLHRDGRTIGHFTRICTDRAGASRTMAKWVRIDAFETNVSSVEGVSQEIVLLILDRHEGELAFVILSFVHDYLSRRSGKELIANAIHKLSSRARGPFEPMNCACLDPNSAEADLFGVEEGGFTGTSARPGIFERVNGGTVFFDEIGEMRIEEQRRLLRILENPDELMRAGGHKRVHPHGKPVSFRCVFATDRDLTEAVDQGTFHKPFLERISTHILEVPPLISRREDIPLLARQYMRTHSEDVNRLSTEALDVFVNHDWTRRNVRGLWNAIARALVVAEVRADAASAVVTRADAEEGIRGTEKPRVLGSEPMEAISNACLSLSDVEAEYIKHVLIKCGNKISEAAKILGIGRNTLYQKIRRYDLSSASRRTNAERQPVLGGSHD